ncbi:MAG: hypothetical protein JWQ12_962 [Glaciihabitans sp.]|jgi:hypothetical protein|nr:hypothetical protein [Glaciihabitans sp.]
MGMTSQLAEPKAPFRTPVSWATSIIGFVVAVAGVAGVNALLPVSGLCQTATVQPGASAVVHCAADAPYLAVSTVIIVVLLAVVVVFSLVVGVRAKRSITTTAFIALVVAAAGFAGYLAFNGVG